MRTSERLQLEAEKLERLAAEIERNPLTRQFREKEQAETLAKRKAAAARLAELDREAAERIPALIEDVAEKEAELKGHEQTGNVIRAALLASRQVLNRARLDYDSGRHIATAELLENYDPRIDEASEFFRKRLDFLRTPGRISENRVSGGFNLFTWKRSTTVETNVNAVNAALSYCQAAVRTLEGMRLEPELDLEKIETLKANIPKVDIYQEVTGEKEPQDTIGPRHPAILEAQASDVENTFNSLMVKASKILSKPNPLAKRDDGSPPAVRVPAAPAPGKRNRPYVTR